MARIVLALIAAVLLNSTLAQAQGAPLTDTTGEPLVWVQIEAQPSLAEAQQSARRYAGDLSDVNGFSLGRGWYAIALGPYRRDEAERVLQVYRREGVIARDSYIAETSDYPRQFWPIGANLAEQPTIAAADAPGDAPDAAIAAPAP